VEGRGERRVGMGLLDGSCMILARSFCKPGRVGRHVHMEGAGV